MNLSKERIEEVAQATAQKWFDSILDPEVIQDQFEQDISRLHPDLPKDFPWIAEEAKLGADAMLNSMAGKPFVISWDTYQHIEDYISRSWDAPGSEYLYDLIPQVEPLLETYNTQPKDIPEHISNDLESIFEIASKITDAKWPDCNGLYEAYEALELRELDCPDELDRVMDILKKDDRMGDFTCMADALESQGYYMVDGSEWYHNYDFTWNEFYIEPEPDMSDYVEAYAVGKVSTDPECNLWNVQANDHNFEIELPFPGCLTLADVDAVLDTCDKDDDILMQISADMFDPDRDLPNAGNDWLGS